MMAMMNDCQIQSTFGLTQREVMVTNLIVGRCMAFTIGNNREAGPEAERDDS